VPGASVPEPDPPFFPPPLPPPLCELSLPTTTGTVAAADVGAVVELSAETTDTAPPEELQPAARSSTSNATPLADRARIARS
jgi:hypothetical protein